MCDFGPPTLPPFWFRSPPIRFWTNTHLLPLHDFFILQPDWSTFSPSMFTTYLPCTFKRFISTFYTVYTIRQVFIFSLNTTWDLVYFQFFKKETFSPPLTIWDPNHVQAFLVNIGICGLLPTMTSHCSYWKLNAWKANKIMTGLAQQYKSIGSRFMIL